MGFIRRKAFYRRGEVKEIVVDGKVVVRRIENASVHFCDSEQMRPDPRSLAGRIMPVRFEDDDDVW